MSHPTRRAAGLAIVVAALGYLVDIYDLILFTVVRKPSLAAIGVPEAQLLDRGVFLLNMQMIGMLIGGIVWGVLGDKRGRLSVLFGSIILYSLANIANGFVHSVDQYAVLRLVAGIGLAGELGAGITLVSELVSKERRGYATTVVAGVGLCGALIAVGVSKVADWRTAYFVGGGLGLALLVLRIGVLESGMFAAVRERPVVRGNFFALFRPARRALRYLSVIAIGIPIWYSLGILITLSPEIGKAMGMSPNALPNPGNAVFFYYSGTALADFGSGLLSQALRSRRRALAIFLAVLGGAMALYFTAGRASLDAFYGCVFILGFAAGYWAVFVTVAAEQFGTNLRATATTTVPNFVRGSVVPVTAAFRGLAATSLGLVGSAAVVGVVVLSIAFVALFGIEETFGKDLDFVDD